MKRRSERTIPRPYPANLPGVTVAWLAQANRCSPNTIRRARSASDEMDSSVHKLLSNLTAEQGLEMARLRSPRGQLPLWSRMAIAEYAKRGATYRQLMHLFGVGRSTVYRALHSRTLAYSPLSGHRHLSTSQRAPIAMSPPQHDPA